MLLMHVFSIAADQTCSYNTQAVSRMCLEESASLGKFCAQQPES